MSETNRGILQSHWSTRRLTSEELAALAADAESAAYAPLPEIPEFWTYPDRRSARRTLRLVVEQDNPVLRRVVQELERAAKEAERHAQARLLGLAGEIAAGDGILASNCSLFLVTERRTLKAAALINIDRPDNWQTSVDDPGIVPRAARDGQSVWTDDSYSDYYPENPHTRSEMVVPIRFDGTVIGVLQLESNAPGSYSAATVETIEERLSELIPHLLVLRSLDAEPETCCPWHPEKHGWDLQDLTGRLCRAFAEGLGIATAKCTFWYVDHDKEERFAYATCGYDWPYHQGQRALRCSGTKLDQFILAADEGILSFSPDEALNFLGEEKARRLEISHGLLKNVTQIGSSGKAIAAVAVYFNCTESPSAAQTQEGLANSALPPFAKLLANLVAAHERHRIAMARAVFAAEDSKLSNCSTATRLELTIHRVCQILLSPAGSLYGYDSHRDVLACITSTGFRTERRPSQRSTASRQVTIPLGDRQGHTIAAFRLCERAFRRNRLSYIDERGLPPHCPQSGSTTVPEFIAGEDVTELQHFKRRFLGCRILHNGTSIGVLRVVRPEKSCPYTKCDERLIEAIADQLADLLHEQMREPSNDAAQHPSAHVK